jgi:hypothetical protein
MTQPITLRAVTRQAGGGEIVRTRRLAASEALIGRAPECDIHLPDLAVDMQHALLRVTGARTGQVESLTGQPSTDGQAAMRVSWSARGQWSRSATTRSWPRARGDIAVTVKARERRRAHLGPVR